jgi:hypothetical protein
MIRRISSVRKAGRKALALAVAVFVVVAFGPQQASAETKLVESGTLTVDQLQVAFIFSGNVGGGKLHYQGKVYDFDIGGLGVGGIGASEIDAVGKVYNLNKLSDFDGAYGQARLGAVILDKSTGSLWLENRHGVYIKIDAKRKGVALSLGVDAVYIKFD